MINLHIGGHNYRLIRNGARDPGQWEPGLDNRRDDGFRGCGRPVEGDLIAWRYAAWRVHRIIPIDNVDLNTDDAAKLERITRKDPVVIQRQARKEPVTADDLATARERHRPFHIVLRHERGPVLPPAGRPWKRLRDGSNQVEVSYTTWPTRWSWVRMPEPYRVCSCHGHPWPCQEIDQQVVADVELKRFQKLEAMHAPGVCAACVEPISTRQKYLTFPEPSLLLPGAPGPTFHAGRAGCWSIAEEYERRGRLADNEAVTRLASCPGIRFIHEGRTCPADKRVECTAGTDCTGLHGPPGYRAETPCWVRVDLIANEGGYARPSFDCGYRQPGVRECIGADMSGGGTSISPTAADILWHQKIRSEQDQGKPRAD
jgi:hypothetical protein